MERYFGGFDPDLRATPPYVYLLSAPLGIMMIMMMNMPEIRFETSFIIDIFYGLRLRHLLFQFNMEMYTSGIHFHAYHHAFSLTRKRVPVVRNFVSIVTLSV